MRLSRRYSGDSGLRELATDLLLADANSSSVKQ